MSVVVELEARRVPAASAHAAVAAEAVYDELLDHVYRCAHCWPWRSVLWRADRLCNAGVALIGAYAEAVVSASGGDEDDANAALSVRLGASSAPVLAVLPGGEA